MLYHRKKSLIYQKDIKSLKNFRTNHFKYSKANDSTRDEEPKIINSFPIKIQKLEEKIIRENVKEAHLVEEKKIIKMNLETNKGNIYSNNDCKERRKNSQNFQLDNNIIYFSVKKNRNEVYKNNSDLRYINISDNNSNNYHKFPNKNLNSKEDDKSNDYESSLNKKQNNNTNYIRYKSDSKKCRKEIAQNYYNNFNCNYNYSNKITPKKENNIINTQLNSEKCGNELYKNKNYSNENLLKHNKTNDLNYISEFQTYEIQKNRNAKKYNSLTYNDLKKIPKKYNKIYEIDKSDIIIKETKIISPEEFNNNQKKIVSKINRLSNILLSNNKNEKEHYLSNNSLVNQKVIEIKKQSYKFKNIRKEEKIKHLFYYISKINSKNINLKKSTKEKIVKIFPRNYKYREKCAKIIQKWWKFYRLIFLNKLSQIISIQSCWRGFFIRKKILNKLNLNYSRITYNSKTKNVSENKILGDSLKKISICNNEKKNKIKDNYNKSILILLKFFKLKKENYIRIFLDKFCYIFNKKETKISLGKNLIQIKKNQEEKLKILYSGFITWAYKAKVKSFNNLDLEFKIEPNDEKNKKTKYKRYYNSRRIINIENNTTKMIKYLVRKKSNNYNDLLRKHFYQWYITSLHSKYNLSLNQCNKNIYSIKLKLYIIIIDTFFIQYNKKYLRLYLKNMKKNAKNGDKIIEAKKNFLENIKSINEGYKLLEKYIFRYTYKHPLYCIMDKINNENIDINLIKILNSKKRNQKEILKEIFLIWKNKVIIEKKNDIIKGLFFKIINIYHKNYIHNLLIKKLYKWKNISYMIEMKAKSLENGRKIFNIYYFIKNRNIKINSEFFFNKIISYKRANKNLKIFLTKIILYYDRKRTFYIIKKFFNKRIHYIIKYEILKLKGTILFNIYFKNHINYYKLFLFRYFNIWKNNALLKYKNGNNTNNIIQNIEINYKVIIKKIKIILLKKIFLKINKFYSCNTINAINYK